MRINAKVAAKRAAFFQGRVLDFYYAGLGNAKVSNSRYLAHKLTAQLAGVWDGGIVGRMAQIAKAV